MVRSLNRSPEEKAEMEREMAAADGKATPATETAPPMSASGVPLTETKPAAAAAAAASTDEAAAAAAVPSPGEQSLHQHLAPMGSSSNVPSSASSTIHIDKAGKGDKKGKKGGSEMTAEQKAKLEEMEVEKEKKREERVAMLVKKLIDRVRPFVNASNPGDKNDEETKRFEEAQRREAEDLKVGGRLLVSHSFFLSTLTARSRLARVVRCRAPSHDRICLSSEVWHVPQKSALLWRRVDLQAQGEGHARQGGMGRPRKRRRRADGDGGNAEAAVRCLRSLFFFCTCGDKANDSSSS